MNERKDHTEEMTEEQLEMVVGGSETELTVDARLKLQPEYQETNDNIINTMSSISKEFHDTAKAILINLRS